MNERERLTVTEVSAELRLARSTLYECRVKHRAPTCIRLPNGDLRVRRSSMRTRPDGDQLRRQDLEDPAVAE